MVCGNNLKIQTKSNFPAIRLNLIGQKLLFTNMHSIYRNPYHCPSRGDHQALCLACFVTYDHTGEYRCFWNFFTILDYCTGIYISQIIYTSLLFGKLVYFHRPIRTKCQHSPFCRSISYTDDSLCLFRKCT